MKKLFASWFLLTICVTSLSGLLAGIDILLYDETFECEDSGNTILCSRESIIGSRIVYEKWPYHWFIILVPLSIAYAILGSIYIGVRRAWRVFQD